MKGVVSKGFRGGKGLLSLVCLSVCLSVCGLNHLFYIYIVYIYHTL